MHELKAQNFTSSAEGKAAKRVKQSMLLVLVLNWLFGMGIIEWPIGRKHFRLSQVYSAFIIVAYSTSVLAVYPRAFFMMTESHSSSGPRKIVYCVEAALTVSFIALAWYRQRGLNDFIRRIYVIDNLVDLVDASRGKKVVSLLPWKLVLFSASLIFANVFGVITIVGIDKAAPQRTYALIIACYSICTMFAVDASFVYCINRTRCNFKLLNKVLKAMLTTTELTPQYKRLARPNTTIIVGERYCGNKGCYDQSNKSEKFKIQMAKKIHGELMKLCDDTHHSYGLQMVLSVFAAFTIITSYTYDSYSLYLSPKSVHIHIHLSNRIVWMFYHWLKIWIISSVCSHCKNEAIKTGDIINELYDDPTIDDETRLEIRNFNIQLIEKPLNFTAYGVFPLDFTLIQVAVGTITTYMMLLRQLHFVAF